MLSFKIYIIISFITNIKVYNMFEKRFEDLLTEKVYDNIHGFVYLTKREKELLLHPYMRRLHSIKQNALACFVFPGATHTRFAHSIGVLYIAEKMIQRLKKVNKIYISQLDHQVIRLAALLHDIGHYPLSHTLETSYREYSVLLEDNETAEIILNADSINSFLQNIKPSDDFHHENMAKFIIQKGDNDFSLKVLNILEEIVDKFDLKNIYNTKYNKNIDIIKYRNLIGELIRGEQGLQDLYQTSDLFDLDEEKEKYYILSKIIKSNLDADQMDYMCRDTANTGIKSSVRVDFIIDNMNICRKKFMLADGSEEIKNTLCFDYRALQSLEQFLLSKFYWYTEILSYPKVYILNLVAQRLYTYILLKEKKDLVVFKNEILEEDFYFFFNDEYFWNKIQKLFIDKTLPKIIRHLLEILIKNKIPKNIGRKAFIDLVSNEFSYAGIIKPKIAKSKQTNFKKKGVNENNYLPVILEKEIIKDKLEEINNFSEDENINILLCSESHTGSNCNNCTSINVKSLVELEECFIDTFYTDDKKPKYLYKFLIYDLELGED